MHMELVDLQLQQCHVCGLWVYLSVTVCVFKLWAHGLWVYLSTTRCVCVHACIVTMDGIEHDNSFRQAEAEVLAADFD